MPVSRFYIYCKSLRLSSGTYLQRLFSTFADGWPGGGLLLQRLLAGGALLYYGAMNLGAAPPHFELAVPQIVGAACGILILAGLWTPLAGTIAAAVEVWIALSHPEGHVDVRCFSGTWGQFGDDRPRGVVRRCACCSEESKST